MYRIPAWIQATLVAAFVVMVHLSLAPRVADLDSFYHIGHAAAYLEGSIWDTSLPWATQSVIADMGADLWWGFHLVLTPFAAFGSPIWGIRLAGVVMTLLLAWSVWFVLGRHGIGQQATWVVLFLVAVPNVLFRYLMVRPHVLSLALSLVLLSLLVKAPRWQVGLVAAAITWLHLSLFWMPLGLLAAHVVSRLIVRPRSSAPLGTAAAAVLVGVLAGWLLRPHPLAAAELAWIQIGELFTIKGAGTPLLFAGELLPLPPDELLVTSWLFLLAWAATLLATARLWFRDRLAHLPPDVREMLAGALLVSLAFFVLTLGSARRAQVEWVAFGALALPLFFVFALPAAHRRRVSVAALAALAIHLPWSVYRHGLNVQLAAFPPDTLEEAAHWLAENTPPGDIVFHARWDDFGPLIAHNRSNRYLSGMDPVFQFTHDPALYWEFFWLSSDIHDEWTCDAFPCPDGTATDSYTVLREHFNASWVLVEPKRNPKLTLYLLRDPRFVMAMETPHEAVFRILDSDPGVIS